VGEQDGAGQGVMSVLGNQIGATCLGWRCGRRSPDLAWILRGSRCQPGHPTAFLGQGHVEVCRGPVITSTAESDSVSVGQGRDAWAPPTRYKPPPPHARWAPASTNRIGHARPPPTVHHHQPLTPATRAGYGISSHRAGVARRGPPGCRAAALDPAPARPRSVRHARR